MQRLLLLILAGLTAVAVGAPAGASPRSSCVSARVQRRPRSVDVDRAASEAKLVTAEGALDQIRREPRAHGCGTHLADTARNAVSQEAGKPSGHGSSAS